MGNLRLGIDYGYLPTVEAVNELTDAMTWANEVAAERRIEELLERYFSISDFSRVRFHEKYDYENPLPDVWFTDEETGNLCLEAGIIELGCTDTEINFSAFDKRGIPSDSFDLLMQFSIIDLARKRIVSSKKRFAMQNSICIVDTSGKTRLVSLDSEEGIAAAKLRAEYEANLTEGK